MALILNSKPKIWQLARDLGLGSDSDPVAAIVRLVSGNIRSFLAEFPCKTLSELLEMATAKLDTSFVEIWSDDDLSRVKKEYCRKGEESFKLLERYLGPEVYAITFLRLRAKRGERRYVSLIDCRGDKAWRAYFSKWHELAHLLTLTSQMRLNFCRSHAESNRKDPEETLMDVVAGEIAFFPDLIRDHLQGEISFEKIDELRRNLCPESSFQASLYGFSRPWPGPCVMVEAGMGYKKSEQDKLIQSSFDFLEKPMAELRALRVNVNELARESKLFVPRSMRVPPESVIRRVFDGEAQSAKFTENLTLWKTSTGKSLRDRPVLVQARKSGEHVFALITPA